MESYSWLRFKHTIATNTGEILAVCLALFFLSGTVFLTGFLGAPIDASPFASSPDQQSSLHAASVEQHASVNVTEDTTAYPAGHTIRNASVYPGQNATDPTVVSRVRADNARVERLALTLTYSATDEPDGNEPFYENETVLAAVEPGGSSATVNATVPVGDVLARKAQLEEEFGQGVSVSVTVATTATYQYETPEGTVVTQSQTVSGPVESLGTHYRFPSGTESARHRTGAVQNAGGSGASLVNWVAILVGLSALFLGVATVGATRSVDSSAVASELQWLRFREWVTEVESYTPRGNVNTVEVTRLNDLVNLAIDTNRRVLYHRSVDEYIVVEDDVMYKFSPDTEGGSGNTELFGLREENLDTTEFPNPDGFAAGDDTDVSDTQQVGE